MAEQVASRRGVQVAGLLLGAGVAVALGVYGRVHEPAGFEDLPTFGFSGTGAFKSWVATLVLVLAAWQLFSAAWLYGKLPGRPAPSWLGTLHRSTGAIVCVV